MNLVATIHYQAPDDTTLAHEVEIAKALENIPSNIIEVTDVHCEPWYPFPYNTCKPLGQ